MPEVRRIARHLALGGGLIIGLLVGPPPSEAKPLRNGLISYSVERCDVDFECTSRIRVVGPRGRARRQLPCSVGPAGECTDRFSEFSPGGRRLAIANDSIGENFLSIVTLGGRTLRSYPIGVTDLAWSPRGQAVAVNDFERIRLLDRASGRAPIYRRTLGVDVAWSRQGRLAWTNEGAADGVRRARDLFVTDRRRRAVRRFNVRGGARVPDWSPGGRRLAFLDDRGANVIDADGTDRRLLSKRCATLTSTGSSLAWSPDGREIACDSESLAGDLLAVNVRTGRSRTILRGVVGGVGNIDWQPRPRGRG